jgi:hypothetical protein
MMNLLNDEWQNRPKGRSFQCIEFSKGLRGLVGPSLHQTSYFDRITLTRWNSILLDRDTCFYVLENARYRPEHT